jgi:hypothetical protein
MAIIHCPSLDDIAKRLIVAGTNTEPQLLVLHAFVPSQVVDAMRAALDELLSYAGSSIYGSSATPLYEYREGSGMPLSQYLDQAEVLWQTHSEFLNHLGNPIRALMEDLERALKVPVERLELLGRPCFFGQYRCFDGDDILPHVDMLREEFPSHVPPIEQQWAVNISLSRPYVGGELQIWPVWPSPEEYVGYGFPRPSVQPAVRFTPSPGDLYLFETGYMHAITRPDGRRCALAGFIGGPWPDRSFRVWS